MPISFESNKFEESHGNFKRYKYIDNYINN